MSKIWSRIRAPAPELFANLYRRLQRTLSLHLPPEAGDKSVHGCARRRHSRPPPLEASAIPLSFEEPEPQDVPHGRNPITPGDLLAFFVSAAVIADGYFVNSTAQTRHLDGEFGFESK